MCVCVAEAGVGGQLGEAWAGVGDVAWCSVVWQGISGSPHAAPARDAYGRLSLSGLISVALSTWLSVSCG